MTRHLLRRRPAHRHPRPRPHQRHHGPVRHAHPGRPRCGRDQGGKPGRRFAAPLRAAAPSRHVRQHPQSAPQQAQHRPRPQARRMPCRAESADRDAPTCSCTTCAPRRSSGWATATSACARSSRTSSTAARTASAPKGPYADKPAYDDLIQAGSGVAALFAQVHGEPAYVPTVICDKLAGQAIAYCDPGRAVPARARRWRPGDRSADAGDHHRVQPRRAHGRLGVRAAAGQARLHAPADALAQALSHPGRLRLHPAVLRSQLAGLLRLHRTHRIQGRRALQRACPIACRTSASSTRWSKRKRAKRTTAEWVRLLRPRQHSVHAGAVARRTARTIRT